MKKFNLFEKISFFIHSVFVILITAMGSITFTVSPVNTLFAVYEPSYAFDKTYNFYSNPTNIVAVILGAIAIGLFISLIFIKNEKVSFILKKVSKALFVSTAAAFTFGNGFLVIDYGHGVALAIVTFVYLGFAYLTTIHELFVLLKKHEYKKAYVFKFISITFLLLCVFFVLAYNCSLASFQILAYHVKNQELYKVACFLPEEYVPVVSILPIILLLLSPVFVDNKIYDLVISYIEAVSLIAFFIFLLINPGDSLYFIESLIGITLSILSLVYFHIMLAKPRKVKPLKPEELDILLSSYKELVNKGIISETEFIEIKSRYVTQK